MTYEEIKQRYVQKGYPFYTKPYDVNLYGIRSTSAVVDEFNDTLGIAYTDLFGNEINLEHRGTTKPGLYWLKNKKGNVNGTAILVPDHYKGCWAIGKHKGEYEALIQSSRAGFKVWRDNDSDGQFDYTGPIYTDVTGINMHTESLLSETEKVGPYSAGCQVRQFDQEHFMVMQICEMQTLYHGSLFSYTLFD
jgi:hypothetical protein